MPVNKDSESGKFLPSEETLAKRAMEDADYEYERDHLSMFDLTTKRVRTMYEQLLRETKHFDDINWRSKGSRQERKEILSNLRAMAQLIKDLAQLQGLTELWEKPRKNAKKKDNVIDFLKRAQQQVKEAEKSLGN